VRKFALLCLILAAAAAPGAKAQIGVTPGTLDFGNVVVGNSATLSTSLDNMFTNVPEFPVAFVSTNADFQPQATTALLILGMPLNLNVAYTPSGLGASTGQIHILDDRPVVQQSTPLAIINVTGTGTPAVLFSLSAPELDFGAHPIGTTSAPLSFRIDVRSNVESINFTIGSSTAAVFTPTPARIQNAVGGQSFTVETTFTPNMAGLIRGAIIVSGGGQNETVVVTGVGASFDVSPLELSIGSVLLGCPGTGVFNVMPFGLTDMLFGTTDGQFTVTPAQVVTDQPLQVAVRFDPAAPGPAQTTFTAIARDPKGAPVDRVERLVTGTGVEITVSPTALSFGSNPVGAPPITRTFTLTANPVTGDQFDLLIDSTDPSFRLVSAEAGQGTIAFSPNRVGSFSETLTLQIFSKNAPDCGVSLRFTLTGTGTEPDVTVNPTSLQFGDVQLGDSARQQVVLANNGADALMGTVASSNPDFSIVSGGTAIDIPAGEDRTFEVEFAPSAAGPASATITFSLSDVETGALMLERVVSASGNGLAPTLSYSVQVGNSTTPIEPGGVASVVQTTVGSTENLEFRIRNDGVAPAPLDRVSIASEGFAIVGDPALPTTIAPGASFPIMLAFSPSFVGPSTANLDIDGVQFRVVGVGLLAGVQITGLAPDIAPAEPSQIGVGVIRAAPLGVQQVSGGPITGTLTLNFTPADGLPNDPAVQFENGLRTADFAIAEGSDTAQFLFNGADTIGLVSGTTAGSFDLSAVFNASGSDVSPEAPADASGSIAPAAPVIMTASVEGQSATGLTVVVEGFSVTREVTQATFVFSARGNVQLDGATSVPDDAPGEFTTWFESNTEFGGTFSYSQPFTFSGEPNPVSSVAITLTNAVGASATFDLSIP